MAKQLINTGSTANDGTGDTLRVAFNKVNNNTNELYTLSENGSSLEVNQNDNFFSTPTILDFGAEFELNDPTLTGNEVLVNIKNNFLSTLIYDPQGGVPYDSAQSALDLLIRSISCRRWEVNETETLSLTEVGTLHLINPNTYTITLIAPNFSYTGLNYKLVNSVESLGTIVFTYTVLEGPSIPIAEIPPTHSAEVQYDGITWFVKSFSVNNALATPES